MKQQGCCHWEWCVGRVIIGLFFVVMGFIHIQAWQPNLEVLKARELTYPDVILGIVIGAEILFGLLITIGLFQRVAAWVLIVVTIIIIPAYLNFWDIAAGRERDIMTIQFLSDLAIIGGLLLLAGQKSKK